MPRRVRTLIAYVARALFRRGVTIALTPRPRGFVPNDGLRLRKLSARLHLEWRTRDLHPWDERLPAARRAERFREQTLHDTDSAIARCFEMLPEVETIDIRVLAPRAPDRLLLAGTVTRADIAALRRVASPGMRLRMLGVRCRLEDGRLEPLD